MISALIFECVGAATGDGHCGRGDCVLCEEADDCLDARFALSVCLSSGLCAEHFLLPGFLSPPSARHYSEIDALYWATELCHASAWGSARDPIWEPTYGAQWLRQTPTLNRLVSVNTSVQSDCTHQDMLRGRIVKLATIIRNTH